MALIEIDGLPINSMVDLSMAMLVISPFIDGLPIKNGDFPWLTVSHNQCVGYSSTRPRLQSRHHPPSFPRFSHGFFRQENRGAPSGQHVVQLEGLEFQVAHGSAKLSAVLTLGRYGATVISQWEILGINPINPTNPINQKKQTIYLYPKLLYYINPCVLSSSFWNCACKGRYGIAAIAPEEGHHGSWVVLLGYQEAYGGFIQTVVASNQRTCSSVLLELQLELLSKPI